ncbi:MAG: hypothetical protein RIG68_28055 [Imperialibacter sp.]|uniref:hypothetical protein n=1 Tax=Imperialibacter sp. TaxID=2038411 RepID=UPI0032EE1564
MSYYIKSFRNWFGVFGILLMAGCQPRITETTLGSGWASTSINAVSFRTNSIVSEENWQFAAYYDSTGHIVLAGRVERRAKPAEALRVVELKL